MMIRIGICDDEKGTCAQIENYVCEFFQNQTREVDIKVWYSGEVCCEELAKFDSVDILFLDIELPMKNGVEVGRFIRDTLGDNGMQIVYISSKTNYAMELFQVHPYDFLVKPIMADDIGKILKKLLILDEYDRRFYQFIINKVMYKEPFGKIQYMQSNNKHIELLMSDGTIRRFIGKLDNEIKKLPSNFVRIAKSYVVNLKYVMECGYGYVVMFNKANLSISRTYREHFKDKLLEYNKGGMY